MSLPTIVINDVGPRDGLQNQPVHLSVEQRSALIGSLLTAGVGAIEVGALVSPKAVPAMAGSDDVYNRVKAMGNCEFSMLIPNMRGYQTGAEIDVPVMSLVVAASSTMNEKNIRMTTAESLVMCADVLSQAEQDERSVQAYVATAWECPFEGLVEADEVFRVTEQLFNSGASHIVVADTIGAAAPDAVHKRMSALATRFGADNLSCHFHDTRAMGVANVYAAIEAGIRRFDASIGGLGGCPFAPGATGNVATEDVVLLVEQMGFSTGIDMSALLRASDLATGLTGTARGGNAKAWLQQKITRNQSE